MLGAEPAFLSLVIAKFLGIKVVATASQTPLYRSDSDFRESIKLDGPANFWSVLNLPDAIHLEEHHQGRIQRIEDFMQRLLIAYSVHLENQADKPDPRWRALPDTVRQLMSNVLNIFSLAESGCRKRNAILRQKKLNAIGICSTLVSRRYHHGSTDISC
jgi:CRISPR-associated protein Csc3